MYYGIAMLAERVTAFLVLPLLTKTLPQELYGVWTQIIISIGLFTGILLVGFQISAVRFLAGEIGKRDLASLFHKMLGLVLFNALLANIITVLFAPALSTIIFGSPAFTAFVRLLGLFWLAEALFELMVAFLRARGEMRTVSRYYYLKNVLRIGILAAGVLVFRLELLTTVEMIIFSELLLVMFIYGKEIVVKFGFATPDLSLNVQWKEILRFSIPLVPYGVLMWGNSFLDRYFILHFLDIAQLSIYAVAYSLAAIVSIIYSVVSFTLFPHMAKLWNEGDKDEATKVLRKGFEYYLTIATPSVAVLTVLHEPILEVFSTSAYVSSWQVVFWLAIGIGVFGIYQLASITILLTNRTRLNLGISAVAVLGNAILNWFLIPLTGILGPAIATAASNGVLLLLTILAGRRFIPISFPWGASFIMTMATIPMLIVLIMYQRLTSLTGFWLLVSSSILAVITYVFAVTLTRMILLRIKSLGMGVLL